MKTRNIKFKSAHENYKIKLKKVDEKSDQTGRVDECRVAPPLASIIVLSSTFYLKKSLSHNLPMLKNLVQPRPHILNKS